MRERCKFIRFLLLLKCEKKESKIDELTQKIFQLDLNIMRVRDGEKTRRRQSVAFMTGHCVWSVNLIQKFSN